MILMKFMESRPTMDLSALNEAQKKAVTYPDGPLLVLAGAGSGKTRVLTSRIAYLLKEKGIDPFHILAITFTNKAAQEMRARIAQEVPDDFRHLWVFTFHAACLRILRQQASFGNFNANFVIYDTDDQLTLIRECFKELNLDDKKITPSAVLNVISQSKNMLFGPKKTESKSFDYFSKNASQVYTLYQEKLERNNALDFDDLLMQTVLLLQDNPVTLNYYQNRFRYILVDEYQDTNHVQYLLVNLLAARYRNLCVVGDPDQGIYGWRGADIQNILHFEQDYPDAATIALEQNYRSTRVILESANAVISRNKGRKEKKLWTEGDQGELITVYCAENESDEGRYVAEKITRWRHNSNKPYSKFAVLYRTNAQSRALEERLLSAGIPYTVVGGLRFYERKEIKDLLAYLRLLVNPLDRLSLRRVINEPKRGLGEASLNKIMGWAEQAGLAPLTMLESAPQFAGLSGKAAISAAGFGKMMSALRQEMPELTITDIVQKVLQESGYWQALENDNTVESRTRLENLREFFTVTGEYDGRGETGGLEDFLASLALVTDLDNYAQSSDQVTLMTLHSAKGLEFPIIFITGLEETVFPHSRSMESREELEEERRLCYVGITRAMDHLYLTYCQTRTIYGFARNNRPSRFLNELPPLLLATEDSLDRHLASKKATLNSGAIGTVDPKPAKALEPVRSYQTGEEVHHKNFGQGVILDVRGSGSGAELKIDFGDLGIKTLMVRYAPLER